LEEYSHHQKLYNILGGGSHNYNSQTFAMTLHIDIRAYFKIY